MRLFLYRYSLSQPCSIPVYRDANSSCSRCLCHVWLTISWQIRHLSALNQSENGYGKVRLSFEANLLVSFSVPLICAPEIFWLGVKEELQCFASSTLVFKIGQHDTHSAIQSNLQDQWDFDMTYRYNFTPSFTYNQKLSWCSNKWEKLTTI